MNRGSEQLDRVPKTAKVIRIMDLADIIGEAPNKIGMWKKKKRGLPTGMSYRIAHLLGCSADWLLTGEGDMRPAREVPEGDYLDPELACIVIAEMEGRQGKDPLQLTAREVVLLETIRDFPKEDRKSAEYKTMTDWIASRRKDDQEGQNVRLIDGR